MYFIFVYAIFMDKIDIQQLTPSIAADYINFKSKEEPKIPQKNQPVEDPKRFLTYRNELIPDYFSAKDFCNMINDFRKKNWEYKEKEKPLQ